MRTRFKYLLLLLLLPAGYFSCERYEVYRGSDAWLGFSTDTVFFDTIFTTIGSATRRFRVYNSNDQPVEISSIELAGGASSVFRMNVDGISTDHATDVEIPPKDSLYIFVEVTLDPNNLDSLLLIHDSILFNTNGNMQDVKLMAWGQDMHLFRRDTIRTSTWINDKPYLIMDLLVVVFDT